MGIEKQQRREREWHRRRKPKKSAATRKKMGTTRKGLEDAEGGTQRKRRQRAEPGWKGQGVRLRSGGFEGWRGTEKLQKSAKRCG